MKSAAVPNRDRNLGPKINTHCIANRKHWEIEQTQWTFGVFINSIQTAIEEAEKYISKQ